MHVPGSLQERTVTVAVVVAVNTVVRVVVVMVVVEVLVLVRVEVCWVSRQAQTVETIELARARKLLNFDAAAACVLVVDFFRVDEVDGLEVIVFPALFANVEPPGVVKVCVVTIVSIPLSVEVWVCVSVDAVALFSFLVGRLSKSSGGLR